jgi:hypothetical protein
MFPASSVENNLNSASARLLRSGDGALHLMAVNKQ